MRSLFKSTYPKIPTQRFSAQQASDGSTPQTSFQANRRESHRIKLFKKQKKRHTRRECPEMSAAACSTGQADSARLSLAASFVGWLSGGSSTHDKEY